MIFTFYSFKGGVGRSMALAHVAWELAQRGLRVLVVDFDLEAPGLERYFNVSVNDVQAADGLMDLITAFKRSLSNKDGMGNSAEFRQIERFVYHRVADFGRGGGVLDLMPAGRRASEDEKHAYTLAVRTFDWQDFYFNWEGQTFFEWLRRKLVDGAEALYDVVLVDSRTGVTEMGGVCACQLADVVVMLSAPNQQNLSGTKDLAEDLLSEAVQRLRPGRPPLQIVAVPARVEQRMPELLEKFQSHFETAFSRYLPATLASLGVGYKHLTLPYEPEFAFDEQTARDVAISPLSQSYLYLSDVLLALCEGSASLSMQAVCGAARVRLAIQRISYAAAEVATTPTVQPVFDPTHRSAGFDAYLSCSQSLREVVTKPMSLS